MTKKGDTAAEATPLPLPTMRELRDQRAQAEEVLLAAKRARAAESLRARTKEAQAMAKLDAAKKAEADALASLEDIDLAIEGRKDLDSEEERAAAERERKRRAREGARLLEEIGKLDTSIANYAAWLGRDFDKREELVRELMLLLPNQIAARSLSDGLYGASGLKIAFERELHHASQALGKILFGPPKAGTFNKADRLRSSSYSERAANSALWIKRQLGLEPTPEVKEWKGHAPNCGCPECRKVSWEPSGPAAREARTPKGASARIVEPKAPTPAAAVPHIDFNDPDAIIERENTRVLANSQE